jgi:hypothetical protein
LLTSAYHNLASLLVKGGTLLLKKDFHFADTMSRWYPQESKLISDPLETLPSLIYKINELK